MKRLKNDKSGNAVDKTKEVVGNTVDKIHITAEEFDSSLVSLPKAIKALDPETKVKIFDGGQKDLALQSILTDYEKGEQIILQGHSVGAGDVQVSRPSVRR